MLGDERRSFYPAGQAVSVPSAANPDGLWVLTPAMLQTMIFETSTIPQEYK